VVLVLSALGNPAAEDFLLRGRERRGRLRRRSGERRRAAVGGGAFQDAGIAVTLVRGCPAATL